MGRCQSEFVRFCVSPLGGFGFGPSFLRVSGAPLLASGFLFGRRSAERPAKRLASSTEDSHGASVSR